VDFLSRWVEARAVKAADAKAAADFLYEDIICKFGLPESIQSDNGSHFINAVISHLNEILKIKHKRSTPYYPQSNGRVERVVGTIKSMLKMAVSDLTVVTEGKQEKCDWVPTLSAVLWVYRVWPRATVGG
jgi:transposase InsO family protein